MSPLPLIAAGMAGTSGLLVADGATVLVDMSARLCLTRKVTRLSALKTAEVRHRPARPGTAAMRADWTPPEPAIGPDIQRFARYGKLLDVVYGPRRRSGEALPELPTPATVIGALDRASQAGERAEPSPRAAPRHRAGACRRRVRLPAWRPSAVVKRLPAGSLRAEPRWGRRVRKPMRSMPNGPA